MHNSEESLVFGAAGSVEALQRPRALDAVRVLDAVDVVLCCLYFDLDIDTDTPDSVGLGSAGLPAPYQELQEAVERSKALCFGFPIVTD
jgi:hypothetical protein